MKHSRREFVKSIAAATAASFAGPLFARGRSNGFSFNCFTKHLQWLDYKETAELLKAAGYDGADLTVRPGGHVLPERVEEDLPRAVEAFRAVGLDVPMIVTKITRADDPLAEKTLRTAAQLGVKIYRMGYLKYDEKLGVEKSIANLRPQVKELADLNRRIGITGAYQNHSGVNVGGPVWDLHQLLKGVDRSHLGIQYDIKHATAEGGRSWLLGLRLNAEHVNCLAIKDFLWQKQKNGRWRDLTVPLGEGMVDYPKFFKTIKQLGIVVPITVHLEYKMPHNLNKQASRAQIKAEEVEIYSRDLSVAKRLMRDQKLI